MEDADRVDDQHRCAGEGSGFAQLSGVPVESSDLDVAAGAERLEDLGAEASAFDAVPVAGAPVDACRVEEVVATDANGTMDRIDDPASEHRLAGTRVARDADGHAAELGAALLDGVDDVLDVGHASRAAMA